METPQIEALAWSPDDAQIALAESNQVEIFDTQTGQSVRSFDLATPVRTVTWKADGVRLAIGRVGAVDIIDLKQDRIITSLKVDSGKPIALWSPDSQTLATLAAYFDGAGPIVNTLKLWDGDGNQLRSVIQMPYARTFAWSP